MTVYFLLTPVFQPFSVVLFGLHLRELYVFLLLLLFSVFFFFTIFSSENWGPS